MSAELHSIVDRENYLKAEESSAIRHEYLNGRVYAMAGASDSHENLAGRLVSLLDQGLFKTGCSLITPNLRIRVESVNSDLYADAGIVCGTRTFENEKRLALLNPKVIFEISSPSTEPYDRNAKFELYKQISTVTDYVLIAQDRVKVDHFHRVAEGWLLKTYVSREESVSFSEIPLTINLGELYRDLDVPSGLALIKE